MGSKWGHGLQRFRLDEPFTGGQERIHARSPVSTRGFPALALCRWSQYPTLAKIGEINCQLRRIEPKYNRENSTSAGFILPYLLGVSFLPHAERGCLSISQHGRDSDRILVCSGHADWRCYSYYRDCKCISREGSLDVAAFLCYVPSIMHLFWKWHHLAE